MASDKKIRPEREADSSRAFGMTARGGAFGGGAARTRARCIVSLQGEKDGEVPTGLG